MKKIKQGFSLAEVLIAIGIVSVIATLGFSVVSHRITTAYDGYVYTGYKAINDAIREAELENSINSYLQPLHTATFTRFIVEDLFRVDRNDANVYNANQNRFQFITSNNTRYTVSKKIGPPNNAHKYYDVVMDTPASATKDADGNKVTRQRSCFLYAPDDNYGFLLPFDCEGNLPNGVRYIGEENGNLKHRRDLLTFYVDDGLIGRDFGDGPRVANYSSFNDTFCAVYGEEPFQGDLSLGINCENIEQTPGVIKVANPKKAFGL